jgi:hypothetical protein
MTDGKAERVDQSEASHKTYNKRKEVNQRL